MPQQHIVTPNKTQFLVGRQANATNYSDLNFDLFGDLAGAFGDVLDEHGDFEIDALVEVFKRGDLKSAFGVQFIDVLRSPDDAGGAPIILVIAMPKDTAAMLSEAFGNRLIVEENAPLEMFNSTSVATTHTADPYPAAITPSSSTTFQFKVTGDADSHAPVSSATIYLLGLAGFAKAVTREDGTATLVFDGPSDAIRAVLVRPQSDYWSRWIDDPQLDPTSVNEIRVTAFGDEEPTLLAGFPGQETLGWGQAAMKLDEANSGDGQGIRVAVIDSGLDVAHHDIHDSVGEGIDFTPDPISTTAWTNDSVGHGTHVTGVVAGLRNEVTTGQSGIRGFAPKAEVFVYKVFPGGRFSDLIKSLQRCVANAVHVVNLSLGSSQESVLLRQTIQHARANGVACIAAAGNSSGPVAYPARWPEVFAVSAIGQEQTYEANSYHAKQVGEHRAGEFFTARFTCFGAEIDVCAPGVAVVSSVPYGSRAYASWDGTSMACPHVVGLAARILEAKPAIRNLSGNDRVEKLFHHIKQHSTVLPGIPASYQGSGLPNSALALGSPDTDDDDDWCAAENRQALLHHLREAINIVEG